MFPLQNLCNGLVDCSCTILSQFIWLQNSPLFFVTYKLDGFTQFSFQGRGLRAFFDVAPHFYSHSGAIRVFHKLVKRSGILSIESKQYALSNLRGIINALCVVEDNGLKNNHPLTVPLPITKPVKFYRLDSHKSLPDFTRGCVVALCWQTNDFLHHACHLLYSAITPSKWSPGFLCTQSW